MIDAISSELVRGAGETIQATSKTAVQAFLPTAAGASVGFDSVFNQVVIDAVSNLKAGEAASINGIRGKASAQQVVEAVMSAEQTLQMAIAVRDKVVAAYQEVSRMAI